jgi:hypothetical protein
VQLGLSAQHAESTVVKQHLYLKILVNLKEKICKL